MCGIVGYTGAARGEPDPGGRAAPAGVSRLRQRGGRHARRRPARSSASGPGGSGCWRSRSSSEPAPGDCGISHTRWATHGPATDRNAHPHLGGRAAADGRRRPQRRDREPRGAPARAGGRGLRLPQPDRHRGHRPPDRPRAGATATTCSRPSSGPCRGSRGRTAWPSSARGAPAQVVGARLGSPLVVGRRRRRAPPGQRPVGDRARTRRGSPTSRTARSSG